MKTADQIVQSIATTIGYIYCHRPLMYGGTGEGVNLLLNAYHQLWAEIMERTDEYRKMYWQVLADEDCGANSFAGRYLVYHPEATEQEIAEYTVRQWRKVSDRLGVPIDYPSLYQEFAGYTNIDWTEYDSKN